MSCVLGRRADAEAIVARHPGIVASLPAEDLELLPKYCWETNTNYEAVKLMLDLGFPVAQIERNHGYTALHNAAWAGSADLVDLLIARGAPVDVVDPTFNPRRSASRCMTAWSRSDILKASSAVWRSR